jgi:hypothetical protein
VGIRVAPDRPPAAGGYRASRGARAGQQALVLVTLLELHLDNVVLYEVADQPDCGVLTTSPSLCGAFAFRRPPIPVLMWAPSGKAGWRRSAATERIDPSP